MKINISLISIFLLILSFTITAQEPDWLVKLKQEKWFGKASQIKLLKSSRSDAERILGKPDVGDEIGYTPYQIFSLGNGDVWLDYTHKECSSTDGKILKNTVEEIDINIESEIRFSKLASKIKIPLDQFKYSKGEGCLPDVETYKNEEYGIYLRVTFDRLNSITFSIPEKKNFSCVTILTFLSNLDKLKQIKLLESTREDVQKIFASYNFRKNERSNHKEQIETDSATIEVSYSEGLCEFDESDGYDVPEWKVENITVSPINDIVPKDFGFDLSRYKKEQVYKDNHNLFRYHDKNSGISFDVFDNKISSINFFPSTKYYPLMCDQEKAEILSSTESLFFEKLEDRVSNLSGYPNIEKLGLSQQEIILNCNSEDKNCIKQNSFVKVYALAYDPENDTLTYSYTVSGGKIIGEGKRVQWDLSGVNAGTYTITAAVDDGCGFCGKTVTKKVVIKNP